MKKNTSKPETRSSCKKKRDIKSSSKIKNENDQETSGLLESTTKFISTAISTSEMAIQEKIKHELKDVHNSFQKSIESLKEENKEIKDWLSTIKTTQNEIKLAIDGLVDLVNSEFFQLREQKKNIKKIPNKNNLQVENADSCATFGISNDKNVLRPRDRSSIAKKVKFDDEDSKREKIKNSEKTVKKSSNRLSERSSIEKSVEFTEPQSLANKTCIFQNKQAEIQKIIGKYSNKKSAKKSKPKENVKNRRKKQQKIEDTVELDFKVLKKDISKKK